MITHDQLIYAIQKDYPGLTHGVDYWVGHEVEGDLQVAEAKVYEWKADGPEPEHKTIIARAIDLLPEYEASQPILWPQFTALQMLDLFSEAEQLAIAQATMTDAAVKLWYDRMIAASLVTYEDPRTEVGLQALVDAGLITSQRKAQIVAAMQPA